MPNLVISGASRGIGRSIALEFAKHGFDIAFCARKEKALGKLLGELKQINPKGRFFYMTADMSKKAEVKGFGNFAIKNLKKIDVLVNNAGVFLPGQIHNEKEGTLEKLIETNLYSAYHLSRALIPKMKLKKSGHVFNISSIAGIQAYNNGGSYGVSKFAMQGFNKALREELKDFGIRVTAVLPGATLTDSWAGVELPESRFMSPDDIASAVYSIYNLSQRTVVEEIILRPQLGDL